MPFGTVPNGTANRIWVGTTQGAVTVPVGGLQSWEYGGESETTEETFYNDFPSITTVADPTRDFVMGGRWNDGDSGLAIIKAGFETKDIIYAATAPEGTNGEGLPVRVSRFRLTGGGPAQAASYQVSLVQAGDPFDVAGGL
jgi:hypothetical protein